MNCDTVPATAVWMVWMGQDGCIAMDGASPAALPSFIISMIYTSPLHTARGARGKFGSAGLDTVQGCTGSFSKDFFSQGAVK